MEPEARHHTTTWGRRGGSSRHRAWGPVLLGLVLAVSGALWWLTQEPVADPGDAATPAPAPPGSSSSVVAGRTLPKADRVVRRPGDPRRLVIPAVGVEADIIPIAAPGGVLTPPADPDDTGWWADGARPGARRGSALVTGHTVHTGGGALDDLEELGDGDAIWVHSDRTRTTYAVESVQILGKGDLAERAEQLFDQGVPGRLVVVTCEDWDGDEYLSNVVVTAAPVTARPGRDGVSAGRSRG